MKAFIFWLLIPQIAGIIGSLFTIPSIPGWYQSLTFPPFRPPNWIFGPVWTTLFFLMGLAAYRVWKKRGSMHLFLLQLGLNTLWSILFFGFHAIGLAFVEIIVLWVFILLTMIRFYELDAIAGYLFLPYSIWVSFASMLNLSIWYLNH